MKPSDNRPTVVLADDHTGVLESVSRLLIPSYDIVATASDGQEALEAVLQYGPDIAVLDISMPGLDGLGVARAVRDKWCNTRIVFLTVHDDQDYISAALETGAHGYVLKSQLQSDLISAIEHALAGRIFVSSHVLKTS